MSLINIKEYTKNLNPACFTAPAPDFSHMPPEITSKVKISKELRWFERDEVYVSDDNNVVRFNKTQTADIDKLRNDIGGRGFNTSVPQMVMVKNTRAYGNNKDIPYQPADGNHKATALDELGVKGYWAWELEIDAEGEEFDFILETIQSYLNPRPMHSRPQSVPEMITLVQKWVNRGTIEKTQASIEAYVNTITLDKSDRSEVIAGVLESDKKIKIDFYTYNEQKISNFLRDGNVHTSNCPYFIKGHPLLVSKRNGDIRHNWDKRRDLWGFSGKLGSGQPGNWARMYYRIQLRYSINGKKSYLVGHVDQKANRTLNEERMLALKLMDDFNTVQIKCGCPPIDTFINFLGFWGQTEQERKAGKIITPEEVRKEFWSNVRIESELDIVMTAA